MSESTTIAGLVFEGQLDKEKELQVELDGMYAWVDEAEARQIMELFTKMFCFDRSVTLEEYLEIKAKRKT